jgi:hypothetical protein
VERLCLLDLKKLPILMHLAVLLHGLNGSPSELFYILNQFNKRNFKNTLVKAPSCNYQVTSDGVKRGAERLFDWILNEILIHGITHISFIGHSLGGIYARYCLGLLHEFGIIPYTLTPVNFITLATPHLGARQHVWIGDKLHAFVVRNLLKNQTILELTLTDCSSRHESLMHVLTSDYFLNPLKMFPNLVAYGNTNETTVNYNSSVIRRARRKTKEKYKWPNIVLDDHLEDYTKIVSIEDKIYQVLEKLRWKRFAVYPSRLMSAHTDIIVRSEKSDHKHGSHVVDHLLNEFKRPVISQSKFKESTKLGNGKLMVAYIGMKEEIHSFLRKSKKYADSNSVTLKWFKINQFGDIFDPLDVAKKIYCDILDCLDQVKYSDISFISESIGSLYTRVIIERMFQQRMFSEIIKPQMFVIFNCIGTSSKTIPDFDQVLTERLSSITSRFALFLFGQRILYHTSTEELTMDCAVENNLDANELILFDGEDSAFEVPFMIDSHTTIETVREHFENEII